MIRTPTRLPALWLALSLLLAACQSGKEDVDAAPLPLSGPALREILTANTLTQSGGTLWQSWDYAGLHREDGTMTGRVVWSGEEERAQGTWEITPEGLYCRAWGNHWGGGGRGCFRAAQGPQTLVFEYVSGARGKATHYIYQLAPGNPYGL